MQFPESTKFFSESPQKVYTIIQMRNTIQTVYTAFLHRFVE